MAFTEGSRPKLSPLEHVHRAYDAIDGLKPRDLRATMLAQMAMTQISDPMLFHDEDLFQKVEYGALLLGYERAAIGFGRGFPDNASLRLVQDVFQLTTKALTDKKRLAAELARFPKGTDNAIFLSNVDALSPEVQYLLVDIMHALHQNFHFFLKSEHQVNPKLEGHCCRPDSLFTLYDYRDEQADQVKRGFARALVHLTTEETTAVFLPANSGKTTFARVLARLAPVQYLTFEPDQPESISTHQPPPPWNGGVVIVDGVNKVKISKIEVLHRQYPKLILVSTQA